MYSPQHIGYSQLTGKHKANRYFREGNVSSRNNADVTHCEKNSRVLFSKQSAENMLKKSFLPDERENVT